MANFNTGLTKQQIITALTKALESMSEQEVQSAISSAISGKQDELTFDNTPTSGSNNPVKSGGIYTDQQRQETEIGVVAALGAKNLLPITAESQTKNGVEMAVNADGTLTFTRTATASSDSYFTIATFTGDAGRFYTLTGCPQGGTDSTFYQYIGGTFRDYGSGVTRDGGTLRNVVVFISKNYSPDNLVFKPMLRPAEITDDTFVPYAPTNRELYEMILALQSGRSVQSATASLMQAGQIDAELMDNTDNDASEKSGGEEMR